MDKEVERIIGLFQPENEELSLDICAQELIKTAVTKVQITGDIKTNVGVVRRFLDDLLYQQETNAPMCGPAERLRLLKRLIEHTHNYAQKHPEKIK